MGGDGVGCRVVIADGPRAGVRFRSRYTVCNRRVEERKGRLVVAVVGCSEIASRSKGSDEVEEKRADVVG